jgi:hypothetical protein
MVTSASAPQMILICPEFWLLEFEGVFSADGFDGRDCDIGLALFRRDINTLCCAKLSPERLLPCKCNPLFDLDSSASEAHLRKSSTYGLNQMPRMLR